MNMVICTSLLDFEKLITAHEAIISKLIQQDTIKAKLFKDFNGTIKSLGAWGGDFVLVTQKTILQPILNQKGLKLLSLIRKWY